MGATNYYGGIAGRVVTDFGGDDTARAVTIQSDDRIVVTGASGFNNFSLARYNADGTLDSTYGEGGRVVTTGSDRFGAYAAVLQVDNRIVVAGGNRDFVLVRYDADGTPDRTFGTDGVVRTDFSSQSELARAVVLQSDGKIIAAGESNRDFALARYNPDGTLDTSFGTAGRIKD